jgi:hypothetical protein
MVLLIKTVPAELRLAFTGSESSYETWRDIARGRGSIISTDITNDTIASIDSYGEDMLMSVNSVQLNWRMSITLPVCIIGKLIGEIITDVRLRGYKFAANDAVDGGAARDDGDSDSDSDSDTTEKDISTDDSETDDTREDPTISLQDPSDQSRDDSPDQ